MTSHLERHVEHGEPGVTIATGVLPGTHRPWVRSQCYKVADEMEGNARNGGNIFYFVTFSLCAFTFLKTRKKQERCHA